MKIFLPDIVIQLLCNKNHTYYSVPIKMKYIRPLL